MKCKTLFHLLLKFLGVWFVTEAIMTFVGSIVQILSFWPVSGRGTGLNWWVVLAPPMAAAPTGLGLYLLFGGRWIADKAIPGNRPYCHECRYDLTHARSHFCPECGTEFRATEAAGRSS